MLGRQNSSVEQLTSQLLTSVQIIPANVVTVDYKHVVGLSVKRETATTIKKLLNSANLRGLFLPSA